MSIGTGDGEAGVDGGAGIIRQAWEWPGPVSAAYAASLARANVILGPVGSGKTTTTFMRHVLKGHRQPRSRIDGKRRYKLLVVREDYRRLWQTTIPSWWKRFPKEMPGTKWTGAKDSPALHEITFRAPDGVELLFAVEFIAIGDHAAEDVLPGYEPTSIYLNEVNTLQRQAWAKAFERWGRYPDPSHCTPVEYCVDADCNAPNIDDWSYAEFFGPDRNPGLALFRQPAGLDPAAENTANLPPGYYEDMIALLGVNSDEIRRAVFVEFGYSKSGKPVYGRDWQDRLHVAGQALAPAPELPLLIGVDAGRTPAAIMGQVDAAGRWRILDELIGEDMGVETFAQHLLGLLRQRYPDWVDGMGPWRARPQATRGPAPIQGWGDPAAGHKGDQSERSWLQILSSATGIDFRPAPCGNNDLSIRLEAVRGPLKRVVDGRPAFQLSPRCAVLRRGFNGGYRYRKFNVQTGSGDSYAEKPEKNADSHPHDACQYLMVGGGEGDTALGRDRRRRGPSQIQAISEDAPMGLYAGGGQGGRARAIVGD